MKEKSSVLDQALLTVKIVVGACAVLILIWVIDQIVTS